MMPGVVAGFPRKTGPVGGTFTVTSAFSQTATLELLGYFQQTGLGSISPLYFNYLTGAAGAVGDRGAILGVRLTRSQVGGVWQPWELYLDMAGNYPTAAEFPSTLTVRGVAFARAAATFVYVSSNRSSLKWSGANVTTALLPAGQVTTVVATP